MSGKLNGVAILVVVGLVVAGGVVVGGIGTGPSQNAAPSQEDTQQGGTGSAPDETNAGESATISVKDAGLPGWVNENETMRPSLTLLNDGDTDRQQTVELVVDDDGDGEFDRTVATRETTVPAGQTSQVTFALDPPEPGNYEYAVVTGDQTQMDWSVEVLQPPTFVVETTSADGGTVQGANATVSARVVNEGDYSGDGTVELRFAGETVTTRTLSIDAGDATTLSLTLPTAGVEPGTHEYTLATAAGATAADVEVLQPATFTISNISGALNVSRGTNATVAATVTNTGEVDGTETVSLRGLGDGGRSKTVSLAANESRVVEFGVPTDDLEGSTYSYTVSTDDDETTATRSSGNESSAALRVREGYFEVTELRGNETVLIGNKLTLGANVTNTGDARATQTVDVRIDLVRGPEPEKLGLMKNVTLAPGEETTVRFWIPYMEDPDPLNQVEDLPSGSYIYGVYTEDENETAVFDARPKPRAVSTGGDSSSDSESTDESLFATLDEISQEKYGLYYESLSGETKAQIEEIYQRQPFADGMGITDVRTREEIARQEYGLDVAVGDKFDFNGLDIQVQQQIEADFDAQFTSQSGDRIESWDELAQREYDTTYDSLSADRQEEIRTLYQQQFD